MYNRRDGRRPRVQAIRLDDSTRRARSTATLGIGLVLGLLVLLGTGLPFSGLITPGRLPDLIGAPPAAEPAAAPPAEAAAGPAPPPPPTATARPLPTTGSPVLGMAVPTPVAALLASPPPPSPLPAPSPAPTQVADAPCAIGGSFARLVQALGPEAIGACLEHEYVNLTTGDSHQRTARGLLVFVRQHGVPAFTDGGTTWYGCTGGVERRTPSQPFPC